MATAQGIVDRMNAEMIDGLKTKGALLGKPGVLIEATETQALPMVALYQPNGGGYRVAGVIWYLNSCHNPQATVYLFDTKDLDEAETLYLEILEMHGFLAFGMEFRLSVGSGMRYIKTHD